MNAKIKLLFLGLASAGVVTLEGRDANAQGSGPEFALRTGYSRPFGNLEGGGTAVDSLVSGAIPIELELGYSLSKRVMIGAYGQYGVGFSGHFADAVCDESEVQPVNCSSYVLRLGVQVHYHFAPERTLDPWIGFGAGYEGVRLGYTQFVDVRSIGVEVPQAASIMAGGLEFARLQAGLEFKIDPKKQAGIGPFVNLSFGEYTALSCRNAQTGLCDKALDKAIHEWLTLGVRLRFNP